MDRADLELAYALALEQAEQAAVDATIAEQAGYQRVAATRQRYAAVWRGVAELVQEQLGAQRVA